MDNRSASQKASKRAIDNAVLGGIGVLLIAFVGTLSFTLEEHAAAEGKKAPPFSIHARALRGQVAGAQFLGHMVPALRG